MSNLPSDHVFVCSGCGKSIREWTVYLDLRGEQYCMSCVHSKLNVAEIESEPKHDAR
jgi:hypothetical protein